MEFVYTLIGVLSAMIWAIFWGAVVKKIADNKGYRGGFWLGFLLGVIGLVIALKKQPQYPASAQSGEPQGSRRYMHCHQQGSCYAAPAGEQTATDKLLDLKHLLDSGVLTQEEFDRKKQELLDQI